MALSDKEKNRPLDVGKRSQFRHVLVKATHVVPPAEIPKMQQPHPHMIHIVVEVDGKNKPASFDRSSVTGREIREKAGAPSTDDLTRLVHGKPSGGNIGLDEKVEIRDGDHFIALPAGTVS